MCSHLATERAGMGTLHLTVGASELYPNQARGAEHEVSAGRRLETQPTRREHPQKVPAREDQHIPRSRAYSAYHSVGSGGNLFRSFTARAAIAEQLPSGTLGVNIGSEASFILAVVPFEQIAIDFVYCPEAGQYACADRALQGTGGYLGESESTEPLSKIAGVPLALLCQWQIRQPRVLARQGPGGLSMPRQVNNWEAVDHDHL
jgi:hypothetical protein